MTVSASKYASLFDSLWQILPESEVYSLPVGGRQNGGTWIDATGIDASANQAEIVRVLVHAKVRRSLELLTNRSSERHYASRDADQLLPQRPDSGLPKQLVVLHIACRAMLESILYQPQEGERERVAEAFGWFNAS